MKNKYIFLYLLLQFAFIHVFGAGNDSLFLKELKDFVFKEIGTELKGDFYTKWDTARKPYLYVYVSLPGKVECPSDLTAPFIYCGADENRAQKTESHFKEEGYHVFCYKTYANSAALLNERFMSYREETKCFIVFHELMHNYINQQKLIIPYELNEALSDVIGNYGALKYSEDSGETNLRIAKAQIKLNEKIYALLNSTISKINTHPRKISVLNARCQKKIHAFLKDADTFQRDRFDYEVNNAYLLKNQYYSRYYFLLKKVFLNSGTINEFLEIIKHLPEKISDCEKYLKKC